MRTTIGLFVAAFSLSACGGDSPPSNETVSYSRDVQPILQSQCVSCHREGGAGPYAACQAAVGSACSMLDVTRRASPRSFSKASALASANGFPTPSAYSVRSFLPGAKPSPRRDYSTRRRLPQPVLATSSSG